MFIYSSYVTNSTFISTTKLPYMFMLHHIILSYIIDYSYIKLLLQIQRREIIQCVSLNQSKKLFAAVTNFFQGILVLIKINYPFCTAFGLIENPCPCIWIIACNLEGIFPAVGFFWSRGQNPCGDPNWHEQN